MSHKHFCAHCDSLIAEGDFDCEFDTDHDVEACESCAADGPVITGWFADQQTRYEISRDKDGSYSYSVIDNDGQEVAAGSGYASANTAADRALEHDNA